MKLFSILFIVFAGGASGTLIEDDRALAVIELFQDVRQYARDVEGLSSPTSENTRSMIEKTIALVLDSRTAAEKAAIKEWLIQLVQRESVEVVEAIFTKLISGEDQIIMGSPSMQPNQHEDGLILRKLYKLNTIMAHSLARFGFVMDRILGYRDNIRYRIPFQAPPQITDLNDFEGLQGSVMAMFRTLAMARDPVAVRATLWAINNFLSELEARGVQNHHIHAICTPAFNAHATMVASYKAQLRDLQQQLIA
jgi:hypothetical protein